MREQAALAGRDGMLIISIATHGFLRERNGYILGAGSVILDPATIFSLAEIFETISSSAAQRSLVFVDACRERMVEAYPWVDNIKEVSEKRLKNQLDEELLALRHDSRN